jgi:hypothetical protein
VEPRLTADLYLSTFNRPGDMVKSVDVLDSVRLNFIFKPRKLSVESRSQSIEQRHTTKTKQHSQQGQHQVYFETVL